MGRPPLTEEEAEALRQRIELLRMEHRDLDDVIDRLSGGPQVDQLRVRRLKKRRLLLKDTITRLESWLIPDLDA